MRILVVEDEAPARDLLVSAILEAEPEAEIAGELESVDATLRWLATNASPDLLFLDIQLSDGRSFDIFERASVPCPVIFATAFDSFMLEAFQANGIDYLLKPIRKERVAAALAKYRKLNEHFQPDIRTLIKSLSGESPNGRTRFLVRKGVELHSIPVPDVAYFFAAGKLNFLVTVTGQRYVIDHTLADLEKELPPRDFFRAGRGFLLRAGSIEALQAYGKGKLIASLSPPCEVECIVSQERAAAFRAWLDS